MSQAEKKPRLVYVEWDDIAGSASWKDRYDLFPILPCRTVGWLLSQDKKQITLAATHSVKNDDWTDWTAIPKGCIRSIKSISEPSRMKAKKRQ